MPRKRPPEALRRDVDTATEVCTASAGRVVLPGNECSSVPDNGCWFVGFE